ncbi:MAG: O-antigen ligase family protein [Phycisphaerales bacterium]|nr:O-antigen ligase family protein [Phycisphaerales bacterium]
MSQFIGVLAIFALLVVSVYSIARPPWAFALINLMFPFKQVLQGYFPALVVYGPHLSAAIAGIGALAVVYKSSRKQLTVKTVFHPITWATIGLYAMVTFGLLYTPSPDTAMKMYIDAIPYMVVFLFIYPFLLSSLDELRQGLFLTVIIGALVTVMFLFNPSAEWAGGRFIINLGKTYGVTDFTSNPLALADTGGMMMICAAFMNFRDKGRLGFVFTIAGLVLGLALTVVSGSRGQIIFAVIVAVTMYPVARQVKNANQFIGVAAGIGFMLLLIYATFAFAMNEEAQRRWTGGLVGEAADDRGRRLSRALEIFLGDPSAWVIGKGSNSFPFYTGSLIDYPHNIVAEVMLDYGIFGLTLLGIAMYYTFRYSRDMIRIWGSDPVARGTVAAWLGTSMFAFMTSLKQGSIIGQPTPFYYWIIVGKILFDEFARARQRELERELSGEVLPVADDVPEVALSDGYTQSDAQYGS